jgi:hypothetical protein
MYLPPLLALQEAGYYFYMDFSYPGTPLFYKIAQANSYAQFTTITFIYIVLMIQLKKQVGFLPQSLEIVTPSTSS